MNMTFAVRDEGKTIYERMVAAICRPGQSKKQMDNVVSRALGGYPLWRVRACRLGEAGPFSAAAILDLQNRYRLFLAKHAKAVQSADLQQAAQLDAAANALEGINATFHSQEIARYRDLARHLRSVARNPVLAEGADR